MPTPRTPSGSRAAGRAAAELRAHPGVIGVFSGRRRRRAMWCDDPVLCAHVVRKHDVRAAERIPEKIDGFFTDVIEVGIPHAHAVLDTCDGVRAPGVHNLRTSTLTAIATSNSEIWALLSGHGTLPLSNGALLRSGSWDEDDSPEFHVLDASGLPFGGRLMKGEISATTDYALGRFPGLDAGHAMLGHTLAASPIPVRAEPLQPGERVMHIGGKHCNRRVLGIVEQASAGDDAYADHMPLRLSPGTEVAFRNLLVVRAEQQSEPFSYRGESGSLVFDMQRRAVGTVEGGSSDGTLTYVLDLFAGTRAHMGDAFNVFFQE